MNNESKYSPHMSNMEFVAYNDINRLAINHPHALGVGYCSLLYVLLWTLNNAG